MSLFVLFIAAVVIGFGGGWFCKGKLGAKVSADLQVVSDTAKKL